jgi:nucleoside-diphosphate-sugar epimerase
VRVAVTGAGGRLGGRSSRRSRNAPFTGLADRSPGPGRLRPRRPGADPRAARPGPARGRRARRRLDGRRRLRPGPGARACAATATRSTCWRRRRRARGIDLVHVSTNEVFDGRRDDGRGYGPDDRTNPINPYGGSKLAGRDRRDGRLRGRAAHLGIVRTAWLYGRPATTSRRRSWPRRSGAARRASR